MSQVLTYQFARAVIKLNYGDDDEIPFIRADFTEVASPEVQARRWATLMGPSMPPVLLTEFYRENSLSQPSPGDHVIKNGHICIMDQTSTTLSQLQSPEAISYREPTISPETETEFSLDDFQTYVNGLNDEELNELITNMESLDRNSKNGQWDTLVSDLQRRMSWPNARKNRI